MNLEIRGLLRSNLPECAGLSVSHETLEQDKTSLPTHPVSALPLVILPLPQVKARMDQWWVSPLNSHEPILELERLVGAVIRNSSGRTSPIKAVDPLRRRILTQSGSVYQLGMPEVPFAAKARAVLRALGF